MGGDPVDIGMKWLLIMQKGGIIPIVTLVDGCGLKIFQVTKCDQCSKSLLDRQGNFKWTRVRIIDDAVRPLYLCSEKCENRMQEIIAANNGHFPNEKLWTKSVR